MLARRPGLAHARAVLRTLSLVALAGCTGGPRSAPAVAPPEPTAVAGSAGTATPWPAPTTMASPSLRTQTRPLPHDLPQLRALRGQTISRDGARVAYVVRAATFDPKAKPS